MINICFRLHKWNIEIQAEVPKYIQVLRANLSYYLNGPLGMGWIKKSDPRKICFKIYDRTGKEKEIRSKLDQKNLSQLTQYGLCRIVNSKSGDISVFLNTRRHISDSLIYHGGFLHPLFLNLLSFRAMLMHASLVSKKIPAF